MDFARHQGTEADALPDGAHIRPLTSLRFFAALWVVAYAYWPDLATSAMPGFIRKGYLGVELFFTLSGFILCHVYLTAFADGAFSYGKFLWARLARVYPLHIATLAGIGFMALAALRLGFSVDRNVLAWSALPANLMLTQAWGLAPVAGWNHPSWSISAEWFAYLSFPLFAWSMIRLWRHPRLAACGALGLLWTLYATFPVFAGYGLTEATIRWGALRIIPCFALGCASYLVWRRGAADRRKEAALGVLLFGAGILVAAQSGAPDALIVTGFAGLIVSLAKLARAGSGFGSQASLVYLGEISYSIYMLAIPWQLAFVNIAAKIFNFSNKKLPLALWVLFIVSLLPLAAISHHLIEKPARRALKLWVKRSRSHVFASAVAR